MSLSGGEIVVCGEYILALVLAGILSVRIQKRTGNHKWWFAGIVTIIAFGVLIVLFTFIQLLIEYLF